MAVSLLDYVKSLVGEKESYSMADFNDANVPMLSGCGPCGATLGGYNAFPSRSGYIRCGDDIGDEGFATVEEFAAWMAED
ncbi:hypothetical protein ACFRAQ_34870 [Nocardia sp. NPDC056611]|uniref:hypothetical protein n=1 Tax=Nocardia sp. NPDC056611 TaxID=3345877 RepID=UPI00367256BC